MPVRWTARVPVRLAARAGLAVLAGGLLGPVVAAAPAAAADPCTTSGSTVTCTYQYTGASDTFTVPAGVTQVSVDALGAQGGEATDGTAGGLGGTVGRGIRPPACPGAPGRRPRRGPRGDRGAWSH
jgi:outer membrane receptor protein involved in Fe transport